MMRLSLKKILLMGALSTLAGLSHAAPQMERIHFLIPGGAGGGWDSTARGTGEALTQSGLVGTASYENMSGGGGGKAIGYLIENAKSQGDTLMVNSTPIIIRSLTKRFPQNFRDLTPVAGIIGDYAAFVVKADSPIKSFADLVDMYNKKPLDLAVAGGSAPGSMDHLVPVMALKAAGAKNPANVNYLGFDAGGKAMASLLSGEADVLSTGLSEAIDLAKAGEVRILAHTGPKRVEAIDTPTLKEQGIDAVFINWRGLFAAPGLSKEKQMAYTKLLKKMYDTPEWEAVRARNGWVNIFNAGDDFMQFLTQQEKEISELMKELGFL